MYYLFLALLGLVAGLSSGCLGIGGGMIIVPGLVFAFTQLGLPGDTLMHMAVENSLCIMIFLSSATSWFHWKAGHVVRDTFEELFPLVIVGSILGVILARLISGRWLTLLFSLFLLGMIYFLNKNPAAHIQASASPHTLMRQFLFRLSGWGMGCLGGLFGVGGAILTVPFFLLQGFSSEQARGTASALTPVAAFTGAFSFLFLGWTESVAQIQSAHLLGALNQMALLCVTPPALLGSYLGHVCGQRLSRDTLIIIFSMLLLFLSVKMLWTVF